MDLYSAIDLIQLRWFYNYIVGFKKSTLFIIGLIWGFKMIEKTFLNLLIASRLTGNKYDIQGSAALVNLQELITIVYSGVVAYITDVYRGRSDRFFMVVLSTTACIVGYMLNFAADNEELNSWFLYTTLALAHATLVVTLKSFLDNRFGSKCNHEKLWWNMVSSSAAIISHLVPLTEFHLKKPALELIVMMMYSFFGLLVGFQCLYHYMDRMENFTSFQKIMTPVNSRPVNLWLLWVCLSILGLVSASVSTFFILEAVTLAGTDYLPLIILLDNMTIITEVVVSEASRWAVNKLIETKPYSQQKVELLRIGIGMLCCVLCCNFAFGAATNRKHNATMSAYWLSPQFFLLGLMRGFAQDGFQSLCESQAEPHHLMRRGSSLARGAGCILSIVCIFIFGGTCFKKNIDGSSLNKYYSFLAILSVGNAMFYCWFAAWYLASPFLPKGTKPQKDTVNEDKLKDKSL